jgi:DNA-binding CsgD family transcriptional regulator
MEAPPVKYVTTSDGVSIAYCEAGQGFPFVLLPFHHNHVQRRWTATDYYLHTFAQRFRLIHYDSRGQGLSTRRLAQPPSPLDFDRDLEAVLERTQPDKFILGAYGGFGHVAMRYAAAHPERVHALVLFCSSVSFSAWPLSALWKVAEENWDLFLEMELGRQPDPLIRQRLLDYFHESDRQQDYLDRIRAFATSEIGHLLPSFETPTLVLHSLDQRWLSADEATRLSASIADSRVVFCTGELEPTPVECTRAIDAFLAGLPVPIAQTSASGGRPAIASLSPRQLEVLQLIAGGKTTREIAQALVLSERTVQRHVADLYAKLDVRNRAEATAHALKALAV